MSELSNDFHQDLDAIKAWFAAELVKIENGTSTVLADAKIVIVDTLDALGPDLLAAGAAGITAGIAALSGGASVAVTVGVGAAVAAIESTGKALGEKEIAAFFSLVSSGIMKAVTPPAAIVAPVNTAG